MLTIFSVPDGKSICSVRDSGMRGKKVEKHCSRPLVCKQGMDEYI